MGEVVVCVDFGSTCTKAAVVGLGGDGHGGDGLGGHGVEARLLATTERPTTGVTSGGSARAPRSGDVLDGWTACRDELARTVPEVARAEVRACSSAGGGLRIAVAGNEVLVSAEAGRRVALSSGGLVVHVSGGALDPAGVQALAASRPDVVLLTGGTDGGNRDVVLRSARALAEARWRGPVVVACNTEVHEEVAATLSGAATPYVLAGNVVPRIGELAPDSARRAIRALFLDHVIGGKHLSRSPEFTAMVRAATPDAVLDGVQLLAQEYAAERGGPAVGAHPDGPAAVGAPGVVVVDVGGATTDVYSVTEPVDDDRPRDVVGAAAVDRTVEGDLGVRWSAASTVEEGRAAGFVADDELDALRAAAERRRVDPGFLADDDRERAHDARLAALAVGVALRRHAGRAQVRFEPGAGGGRVVERSGVDLRAVGLVVASGGVLRHATVTPETLLRHVTTDGGWQVPERPRVVVDRDYVLAPAGLLVRDHPEAAAALLRTLRASGATQQVPPRR